MQRKYLLEVCKGALQRKMTQLGQRKKQRGRIIMGLENVLFMCACFLAVLFLRETKKWWQMLGKN